MVFGGNANDWTFVNAFSIAHHHHHHQRWFITHITIIIIIIGNKNDSFTIITVIISALTTLMTVSPCHSKLPAHTQQSPIHYLDSNTNTFCACTEIETQWWVINTLLRPNFIIISILFDETTKTKANTMYRWYICHPYGNQQTDRQADIQTALYFLRQTVLYVFRLAVLSAAEWQTLRCPPFQCWSAYFYLISIASHETDTLSLGDTNQWRHESSMMSHHLIMLLLDNANRD